ncbi:MIF4G domain-containing protein-like isoform X2 [Dermacentor andersoni]|uniref:MIF4G domain-containing protein-like isoform X2 n=1 Tax=Dermacentor andersoni TaxID=34620 RepID=UPI002416120F|nr:MIF4G domain-containing protein-like isoform X2 [Dermacentor andersoni]
MQFGAEDLGLAGVGKLTLQSKSVACRPSPGLDMTHGFMKKIQELQMEHLRQPEPKNAAITPTSTSPQTGGSQRSTKPTLEIYRPPEMLCQQNKDIEASDTDRIQCQPFNTTTNGNPGTHPKPRLDHSEVPDVVLELQPAGGSPQSHSDYKKDEYSLLMVKQALQNPTSLSTQQLQRLARGICQTAPKSIEHAEPAAKFCHRIALVSNSVFLEGLLSSCRELFEKREELMGTLEAATGVPLRWTPYVSFVAKLLVEFESSDCANSAGTTVDASGGERPSGAWKRTVQSLAILLSSCFHVILRPPFLGSAAEMECLRSAVTAAGKAMERVAPHVTCALMARLRDAFLEPGTSARSRKVLLELIELRASGWQLRSAAQQMYYHPGRTFQSRN